MATQCLHIKFPALLNFAFYSSAAAPIAKTAASPPCTLLRAAAPVGAASAVVTAVAEALDARDDDIPDDVATDVDRVFVPVVDEPDVMAVALDLAEDAADDAEAKAEDRPL